MTAGNDPWSLFQGLYFSCRLCTQCRVVHPAGPMSDTEPLTVLERHVSYFDPDGDGAISMSQTFRGLRGVGVGALIAALLTLLINLFLGYLTHGKPSTRVSVRNIARGKHPYDTGSFNDRGELDATNFAAL